MDSLPASRFHLMAIGIDCMGSSHSRIWVWNYFVRTVSVLLMVSMLCLQLYGVVCYEKVLIINAVHLTIFSIETMTYVQVFSRTKRLFNILKYAFQRMDKPTLSKIRAFDNHHVNVKFFLVFFVTIGMMTYFTMYGNDREAAILETGLKAEFSGIFVRCMFASMVWTAWTVMFLTQFYMSILFVTVQIAGQMRSKFLQWTMTGEPDYEMMRRSLEWYNRLMKIVNEEAGIIPFGLLAMEFTMFACGISFVVTGSEVGISPMLALLTCGSMNVSFVRSFYQLIRLSTQSRRYITKAWKIAEESVADPFMFHQSSSYHATKTRKSLKFFLITESVVPAKAIDNIVIDHSLILNFFHQLIPFTVMMFTTLKEFDRKA